MSAWTSWIRSPSLAEQGQGHSWRSMVPLHNDATVVVDNVTVSDLETQSQDDCLFGGVADACIPMQRKDSMELVNDPRFFTTTVIEKRLYAFSGLATLGTLFISSSMSQMYALKKNTELGCCSLNELRDMFQLSGFFLHMIVAFMLTTGVFVQVQQIFYTYRLLTSGPTGFEQASLFYLHPTMTKWRHRAMQSFFSGIPAYLFASGWVLSVKFVKDAHAENQSRLAELAMDLGVAQNTTFRTFITHTSWASLGEAGTLGQLRTQWQDWIVHHPADATPVHNLALLNMNLHAFLAAFVLVIFAMFCCFLHRIRMSHLATFQLIQHDGHYKSVKDLMAPLRAGSSRSQY